MKDKVQPGEQNARQKKLRPEVSKIGIVGTPTLRTPTRPRLEGNNFWATRAGSVIVKDATRQVEGIVVLKPNKFDKAPSSKKGSTDELQDAHGGRTRLFTVVGTRKGVTEVGRKVEDLSDKAEGKKKPEGVRERVIVTTARTINRLEQLRQK